MTNNPKPWAERSKRYRTRYLNACQTLYEANHGTNLEKATQTTSATKNVPQEPERHSKVVDSNPVNLSEAYGQSRLVLWARENGLPLISIPNGGKRTAWSGQREKALGLTPGVSDLFLAVPSGVFHGYWVEMKAHGKKPTPLQREWMTRMVAYGYQAEWFDDWLKAKKSIMEYLKYREPETCLASVVNL
jgi:hypothetical protein